MGLTFSKQVLKDIQDETKEIQEKLLILFRALEEGANFTMPVSRHIFVLHLFRKKTQKTPQQEIETAIQRLKRMKEEFDG